MSNITESLFEAISTIAEKRIANLQYDKTIICTITNIDNAKNNLYTVSDGSIEFEAQGNGAQYKVGDNVRVLILEGDYTKTKYIQGKHNTQEADKPITYVSALNSILDLTDNMIDPTKISTITGISANGSTLEEWIDTIDLSNYDISNNDIFNTLYIKADFWSAFDQYEMRSGDYGIHIVIGIDNGNDVEAQKRYDRLDLRLSATRDMFGNPYAFKIYTPQEIVCTLSSWPNNAKEIYVYLYQNNNFEYYDYGEQKVKRLDVPYLDSEHTIEISNIKVKNVQVGFGSEIASEEDNKLKIYTNNTQSFDHRKGANDSYNKKAIQLLWYNKSENNEYLGFSDGIYVSSPGYDEETYLSEISTDQRLLNIRDSKTYANIPHDQNCLDLQADINEITEKGKAISKLIGATLWHTLDNFNDAIAGLSTTALNTLLGSDTGSLIKYQEQLDTNLTYLNNIYKNILQAADDKTVLDIDETFNTNLTTAEAVVAHLNALHAQFGYDKNAEEHIDYYSIINSAIESAKNTIQEAVTAAARYQDTYDSYVSSITRTLNKIKKYSIEIYDIYTTLLSGVSGTNSARLAALIKFEESTPIAIGETYGSKLTNDEFVKNNENRYCIYWYKKDVTSLVSDGIMPAGWSRIPSAKNVGLPGQDSEKPTYYVKKDNSSLNLTFSNPVRSENIKAVLFYNHNKVVSNELIFTNDAEVLTDAEINLEGEIIIEHHLNSQDTYQLYNEYGELNNMGDSAKQRKLKAKYSFADVEDPSYLINTTIYWYVPNQSTLLILHDVDKVGFSIVAEDQSERYKAGYTGYYKTITDASSDTIFTYHIKERYQNTLTQNHIICEVVKVAAITEVENEEAETIIDKEETVVHTATQYFNFSSFGNQGTDYTLALLTSPVQPCVINDNVNEGIHTENPLIITPQLHDYNHNKITLLDTKDKNEKSTTLTLDGPSDGYELTVEWEDVDEGVTKYPIEQCKIYKKENNDDYWCMLKCTANNVAIENLNKNINLVSYMPISYSPANEFYIEGASTIIYSSSGNNPVYYKSPYKLYNKSNDTEWTEIISEVETKAAWKIRYYKYDNNSTIFYYDGKYDTNKNAYCFYDNNGELIDSADTLKAYGTSFVPKLDKENCLITSNCFIDNLDIYPVAIAYKISDGAVLWAQPLLIRQNKHSSAMLNSWDGSLSMDKENNTILTSMVGAGRKNSNNEFEGVLMGDVMTMVNDNSITTLGIYGYNDGAQSFGFKIDGTGFIGKSGKGRILLNGDTSEIKSQRYDNTNEGTGMRVDLDNGILDIKNNKISLIQLNAKDVGHTSEPYMYIKKDSNTPLVWINDDDYYLQSANYNNTAGKEKGTKFDLVEGHLDAYNFKLTSKNVTIDSSATASAFFEIKNNESKSLFKASNDQYYLQTADFDNAGTGVKIDLSDGSFKLKTPQIYLGDTPENNYYFKIGDGLTVDSNYNLSVTGDINATSGHFNDITFAGGGIGDNLLTKTSTKIYEGLDANIKDIEMAGYNLTGDHNTIGEISGMPYESIGNDNGDCYPHWVEEGDDQYLRMIFTAEPGDELYYRFTIPLQTNSEETAKWFKSKTTYQFSGKLSVQHYKGTDGNWNTAISNIKNVKVRTQANKGSGYYGGINKVVQEGITAAQVEDTNDGTFERIWGSPTFKDFKVQFTIDDEAITYYVSFQIEPNNSANNCAVCLCLKDLELKEMSLCGEISSTNGFALWKGAKIDDNLVFKVKDDGLYLKGKINAEAGGTIGGWNIGSNSITIGTLGSVNSFHMYSSGSTMLSIGSHFRVDNTGAIYASAGNIAGFYINSKDLTILGPDNEIRGFISKGITNEGGVAQDNYYGVGPQFNADGTIKGCDSGVLERDWFIWNRGSNKYTFTDENGNSGLVGTFGIDINGNLFATAGYIGPLEFTSAGLGVLNTSSDATTTFISSNALETNRILISGVRIGQYSTFYGWNSATAFPSSTHIMHWLMESDSHTQINKFVTFTKKGLGIFSGKRGEETRESSIEWDTIIKGGSSGAQTRLFQDSVPQKDQDEGHSMVRSGMLTLGHGWYLSFGEVALNTDKTDSGVTIQTTLQGIASVTITPIARVQNNEDAVLSLALKTRADGDLKDNEFRIVWKKTGSLRMPIGFTYIALGYDLNVKTPYI